MNKAALTAFCHKIANQTGLINCINCTNLYVLPEQEKQAIKKSHQRMSETCLMGLV